MMRHPLDRAGLKADEGRGGAVALIHCFGCMADNEAAIVRPLKTVINDLA